LFLPLLHLLAPPHASSTEGVRQDGRLAPRRSHTGQSFCTASALYRLDSAVVTGDAVVDGQLFSILWIVCWFLGRQFDLGSL